MAIGTEIEHASIDELKLDPLNPRLGHNNTGPSVKQSEILEMMKDWTLDELATSFIEGGGFWPHEAVLVVEEKLYGTKAKVVVEGNRRLAALNRLRDAVEGRPASKKWAEIASSGTIPKNLFTRVPFIRVDSRDDVEAFLGFRHVTGIAEWRPAEKAEFIARMVDKGMSYEEVMRKIGSKTPTVRQNYIAYKLMLQMEKDLPTLPRDQFEERFSVMYLSLRTAGVQQYLDINLDAEPNDARTPVPKSKTKQLARYSRWLFGDEKHSELFTDSRKVDDFGRILASSEAVQYLERTEEPRFDIAFRLAGGDEPELIRLIEIAADNIELTLTRIHLYKKSKKFAAPVERLGLGVMELLKSFPTIRQSVVMAES
jgi:hypothetical protein